MQTKLLCLISPEWLFTVQARITHSISCCRLPCQHTA